MTPKGDGSLRIDSIDLKDVNKIVIAGYWEKSLQNDYHFEVRLDSPDGKNIGEAVFRKPAKDSGETNIVMKLDAVTDGKFHDVVIVTKSGTKDEDGVLYLKNIQFNN